MKEKESLFVYRISLISVGSKDDMHEIRDANIMMKNRKKRPL